MVITEFRERNLSTPQYSVVQLKKKDINEILTLERASWVPELQASKESILDRLNKRHVMLGIKISGKLVGKICFYYSFFSPNHLEAFPAAFKEFSHLPSLKGQNTAFVYNLDIHPKYRGMIYYRTLMRAAFNRSIQDKCRQGVFDGRPSSYNGSQRKQECIKQQPKLKKAIDRYMTDGKFPSLKEFILDPTLALYRRLTNCHFLKILPNFLIEDQAAGGFRILCFVEAKEVDRIQ